MPDETQAKPLPEQDRIEWTNPVRDERGRYALHFKNLTRAEAAQMLMCLDKLQTDRKTALYLGDKLSLDAASKPEHVGLNFARENGIADHSLQRAAAREFTTEHGVNIDKFNAAMVEPGDSAKIEGA
jgi:hypothetical protein